MSRTNSAQQLSRVRARLQGATRVRAADVARELGISRPRAANLVRACGLPPSIVDAMRGDISEVAAMADRGPLVSGGNEALNPAAAAAFESAKVRMGEVTGAPNFADRVVAMVRTGKAESTEFQSKIDDYNKVAAGLPPGSSSNPMSPPGE